MARKCSEPSTVNAMRSSSAGSGFFLGFLTPLPAATGPVLVPRTPSFGGFSSKCSVTPGRSRPFQARGRVGLSARKKTRSPRRARTSSRSWARLSWMSDTGCAGTPRRWRIARPSTSSDDGVTDKSSSTRTAMASRGAAAGRLGGRNKRSMGSTGSQMPESTERAAIAGALAGHAGEQRGVEGVALRAITPFAGALVFALIGGGFLHRRVHRTAGVFVQHRRVVRR